MLKAGSEAVPMSVVCPDCRYVNDDGVVFCHNCGRQLVKYSREQIEELRQRARCPLCGTYNPIESTVCMECGAALHDASDIIVRDESGRIAVIRDLPPSTPLRLLCNLLILFMLIVMGFMTASSVQDSQGDFMEWLSRPGGAALVLFWLVVSFTFVFDSESTVIYKVKMIYTLALLVIVVSLQLSGEQDGGGLRMGVLDADRLMLLAFVGAILYCAVFLLSVSESSLVATLVAAVGLYGLLSAVQCLVDGGGFDAFVRGGGALFESPPFFLTPAFLVFHLYLPYVFLLMSASLLRSYARTLEKVEGLKSISRFFRMRRLELKGEVLNLFASGAVLFHGFTRLHAASSPNLFDMTGRLTGWW